MHLFIRTVAKHARSRSIKTVAHYWIGSAVRSSVGRPKGGFPFTRQKPYYRPSVTGGGVNKQTLSVTQLQLVVALLTFSREFKTKTHQEMELKGRIIVYSILGCPHCMAAKKSLKELNLPFTDVRLDLYPQEFKDKVMAKSNMRTVPQVYFNELLVGGNQELQKKIEDVSALKEVIQKVKQNPFPKDGPPIPDPNTALPEADPFGFECEPDEYFFLLNEMKQDKILRTHRSFLTATRCAFSGKEFAQWVIKKKGVDESRAVEMGQALLDRRFVQSKDNSSIFSPGSNLYTLIQDDNSGALNGGQISDCTPKSANEIGETMRKMILKLYGVFLSDDGKAVDYKGMKESSEFAAYVRLTRELQRVDIESATREEKLAFFINVYNALVVHANVERGPPTNLWGRYKFFNSMKYLIGGHSYSLQDMENGVLRANRKGVGQFSKPFAKGDPRLKAALDRHEPLIHFALVCGAKSCPPIKTYSAQDIYKQLQMAAASFLDGDDCQVDLKCRSVKLSMIFKWYGVDFGKNNKELLEFLADHMGDGQKKTDLQELIKGCNYTVSFLKYDWSVNSK